MLLSKAARKRISLVMAVVMLIAVLFLGIAVPVEVQASDAALRAALGEGDIVVDNADNDPATGVFTRTNAPGASGSSAWGSTSGDYSKGYYYGMTTHRINNGNGATAQYTPVIPRSGVYAVYVTFVGASNRADNVSYEIFHHGEARVLTVNQQQSSYNGQWYLLGEYYFAKGTGNYVKLDTAGTSGWVMADAVRFAPILLDEELDDDASLSDLMIVSNPGELPLFDFQPQVTEYSFNVFNHADSIHITATASSELHQEMTINDIPVESGVAHTVFLEPGLNLLLIKVTAQDGTVNTYIIKATRLSHDGSLSDNAYLSSLAISPGSLVFDRETTQYNLVLGSSVESIGITPVTEEDSYQNLKIKHKLQPFSGGGGEDFTEIAGAAESGGTYTVELAAVEPRTTAGNTIIPVNVIAVEVTAEDGTTVKTYNVTVTREPLEPLEDSRLREQLREGDVVVDNADPEVIRTGLWAPSRFNPGNFYGNSYENIDGRLDQGQAIQYVPDLPEDGMYEVYVVYNAASNRADKVVYEISHGTGISRVEINQQKNGGIWVPLGSYYFAAGTGGSVKIDSAGANGYVMADAVRFALPADDEDGEEQDSGPWRVYEPVGPVMFRSGFEEGTTAVMSAGTLRSITGTDHSVEGPNDWVEDLETNSPFGSFGFAYAPGTDSDERYARLIDDPTAADGSNKVLHYWLGGVGAAADRGRVQATMSDNEGLTEVYYKYRMYLHPDLELMRQSFDANGWFTIAEFWNQPSWQTWSEFPFRVALNLTKEIGVGQPLKFRVSGQTTPVTGGDDSREFVTIWQQKNSWEVPTGVWLETELYYKQGDGNTGRFYFAVTPEGEEKRVLFDVTNWTHSPFDSSPPARGLTDFHPFKLYTSKDAANFVKDQGGALQIYWDDIEFWPSMREVLSSDARLSSLELSHGTLEFHPEVRDYSITVADGVSSLEVTPVTAAAFYDSLTVNGTGHESGVPFTVPLEVGANTIEIVVTAQDGTQAAYTIDVARASSSAS